MTYAHVVSGAVNVYPFSDRHLRQIYSNTSFPADMTDAVRKDWGMLPVVEEPPEHDTRRQYVTPKATSQWTVQSNKVIVTYTIHERTLQERRDTLIPRIEQMRWDKEVGGMTFSGMPIPTDDRAKTLIMGARTAAVEQGGAYSDEWKISPGVYVPLDAAAAIALGDALLAHIRACFAREKALIQAVLDAEDHDAMDDAEDAIESGWPE
jgi:hypothetical protein